MQEAQANPCATETVNENDGNQAAVNVVTGEDGDERECTIIGNDIDFEED